MPEVFDAVKGRLREAPATWLVTGAAGFIGSNLVEALLQLGQRVVGLDNFSTGHVENLDDVRDSVASMCWGRFQFIEGDVTKLSDCLAACRGVDFVLHQAALGSVPRSIEDPLRSHVANVDGFVTMLLAALDAGVNRFVYAGSSSVYGDSASLPKVEGAIGMPLSPYALTKQINEQYATLFSRVYDLECIGLRYFNVFGPRQDPEGPYAAVIPKWIGRMLSGQAGEINGDGETSRDFCFVENVVQANLLAALTREPAAIGQVYNIAYGTRTSLIELYAMIRQRVENVKRDLPDLAPVFSGFRPGDVRHSQADVGKAQRLLQYAPTHSVALGLDATVAWYIARRASGRTERSGRQGGH